MLPFVMILDLGPTQGPLFPMMNGSQKLFAFFVGHRNVLARLISMMRLDVIAPFFGSRFDLF